MYKNVGKRLKKVAKAIFFVGFVVALVWGIGLICLAETGRELFNALLVLVGGSFAAWLLSLLIYGYGEMVENSALLREKFVPETKDDEETDDEDND